MNRGWKIGVVAIGLLLGGAGCETLDDCAPFGDDDFVHHSEYVRDLDPPGNTSGPGR